MTGKRIDMGGREDGYERADFRFLSEVNEMKT
jgi:hypothetical protein